MTVASPPEQLSERQLERAQTFADRLDPQVFELVLQYGLSVQVRLAGIADEVMSRLEISADDRTDLAQMLTRLKRLDPARPERRFLPGGILALRRGSGREDALLDRFDRMRYRLDRLLPKLEGACRQIGQTLNEFDKLFERNQIYLEELHVLIHGARLRLDRIQRELLPQMMDRVLTPGTEPEHLEHLARQTERLEQRIDDLEASAETSRETGPMIRRIQDDLRCLLQDAQQTSLNQATQWKHRFADAVTRARRSDAISATTGATARVYPAAVPSAETSDAAEAPPAEVGRIRSAMQSLRSAMRRTKDLPADAGISSLWWG